MNEETQKKLERLEVIIHELIALASVNNDCCSAEPEEPSDPDIVDETIEMCRKLMEESFVRLSQSFCFKCDREVDPTFYKGMIFGMTQLIGDTFINIDKAS